MTLFKLLTDGREKLRGAQIAEWELDAWYLLEYVTGCTRHEYLLHPYSTAVSDGQPGIYGAFFLCG